MNNINMCEIDRERVVEKVCAFLKLKKPTLKSSSTKENVKELCVVKLCNVIGLTGNFNYKSEFFDFFSSIMGEAICEKLSLKIHVANDELRFVKYEHVNLVLTVKEFLDEKIIDEAFLDAFNLVDKFKHLIKKLKKV